MGLLVNTANRIIKGMEILSKDGTHPDSLFMLGSLESSIKKPHFYKWWEHVTIEDKYEYFRKIYKVDQTIKLMQEINQGIADVDAGRVMSLEDAKKKLL